MVRVGQFDQHLVRTRRQAGHDHRVVVARVRPMPGQVVDGDDFAKVQNAVVRVRDNLLRAVRGQPSG